MSVPAHPANVWPDIHATFAQARLARSETELAAIVDGLLARLRRDAPRAETQGETLYAVTLLEAAVESMSERAPNRKRFEDLIVQLYSWVSNGPDEINLDEPIYLGAGVHKRLSNCTRDDLAIATMLARSADRRSDL
jgi:hypothetical protein